MLNYMKGFFVSLFSICTLQSFGQNYLDKKIVVTVNDTSGLYQRVRIAFGSNDFQVKEDGNYSAVTTFARELKKTPGYIISRADISGNTVTITGRYGLLRIDDWGRTRDNGNWKDLVYMKNSKIWTVLEKVADKIKGEKSYSK